jgi:signal recognition particle subunit SRP54
LTLIEKAEQVYSEKEAKRLQRKLRKDELTLEDFRDQLRAVRRMGAVGELIAMIPGMRKLTRGVDLSEAEGEFRRIEAIIDSMTREERNNHLILNGSRRKRIAAGSGTSVEEVNRFLKQFTQTKKMMKNMTRLAARGVPPGMSA